MFTIYKMLPFEVELTAHFIVCSHYLQQIYTIHVWLSIINPKRGGFLVFLIFPETIKYTIQ